jgi:membrane associated rhomboid family serine protease
MFIPLKDDNPSRTFPFVNYALIAANVLAFFYELTLPPFALQPFLLANATVPARLVHTLSGNGTLASSVLPLFTSMFLHAGLAHLLGNMLFLWIFGDNVEDHFGHAGYLLFYLFCGFLASVAHILYNLQSPLPTLGASGAISGVMGAYALLYPRARVLTLVLIFLVPLPAFLILGYWFLLQFVAGLSSVGNIAYGGVAWWAHIGGFLAGVAITGLLKRR